MEKMSESFYSRLELLPRLLAKLVGISPTHANTLRGRSSIDSLIQAGDFTFAVEMRSSGRAAQVSMALSRLEKNMTQLPADTIPLLVVPYMGTVGRRLCKEASVSWLDLSGNADISAEGLRVHVEGQKNRFRGKGRPANLFAPKSSRIARELLLRPNHALTQQELMKATGLGKGYTSRILQRLEADGLAVRDSSGAVRAADAALLLDAWHEVYDFTQNRIVSGYVAARSSESLLRDLSRRFRDASLEHAFTGLAAAWVLTRFAGFRVVTCYFREQPPETLLNEARFKETVSGANIWLVLPRDVGVFRGSDVVDEIQCCSPVQIYLDLKGHPERASEAAIRLREEHLRFEIHAESVR